MLTGCLHHNITHQIKDAKTTNKQRAEISHSLNLGVEPVRIIRNYIKSGDWNPDLKDNGSDDSATTTTTTTIKRPITYPAVKVIERSNYKNLDLNKNKSELENILSEMKKDHVRGFNFGQEIVPKVTNEKLIELGVADKVIDTNELVVVMMTEFQKKVFRSNPSKIYIDGTHGTCQSK